MEVLLALFIGLPIGLTITAFAVRERRAERTASKPTTLAPSGRTALLGVPSLDVLQSTPRAADALRGRVQRLYVMNVPRITRGAEAGFDRCGRLFIVDIEGAVHEPGGVLEAGELEALAHNLAQDLGVPFEMR